MTSPRAPRSTHERNLERDIEQRLQDGTAPHPARPHGAKAPEVDEDVAGRLAREAVIREASRRGHQRS